MNPIEAAKAILEAEHIGEAGYPAPAGSEAMPTKSGATQTKGKTPKSSTSPKAVNDAGTNAANGAGSSAGDEGEDESDENASSVDMTSSDAGDGADQGQLSKLAKGVKKKQKKDSGMTEDDDVSFEDLIDEDDDEDEVEETAKKEDDKAKMKEHMHALFADESELSEDFKTKAETIFEAALNERREALEKEYDIKLEESVNILRESLANKIDDYLSYVVEEWYTENKVALETGLRSEIAENFIEGLKGLFEDNYIDVPEDKCNLIEETEDKVENLTKELNEQIEKNVELRNKVNDSACQMIFEEVSDTLTDTEVDKLRSLSEGLEYETQEQYKDKLAILKENYFTKSVSVNNSDPIENVDGSAEGALSGPMSRYTDVLNKMKVKK